MHDASPSAVEDQSSSRSPSLGDTNLDSDDAELARLGVSRRDHDRVSIVSPVTSRGRISVSDDDHRATTCSTFVPLDGTTR